MKGKLEGVSLTTKDNSKLPEGAKILSKEVRISVDEIENGFLICKSYDITYTTEESGGKDYMYYSKKWYSQDNPLEDALDDIEEATSLANKFE